MAPNLLFDPGESAIERIHVVLRYLLRRMPRRLIRPLPLDFLESLRIPWARPRRMRQLGGFQPTPVPAVLVLEDRLMLAASIVVNNATDTHVNGQISLREAIRLANQNAGDDTIVFDSTVFAAHQTITLAPQTGVQLALTDTTGTTTITGPAAGVTVESTTDFNNPDSSAWGSIVFQVDANVNASLFRLTISGGISALAVNPSDGTAIALPDGGGVRNFGTVELVECTLRHNSGALGGGLANFGTATLTDCTVSDNLGGASGGGVFNAGAATLTMTDCTLQSNRTLVANLLLKGDGGGLANFGTATLTNCTVRKNTVATHRLATGGGVYNDGFSTLNMANCTITENSATQYGGGVSNRGTATLANCTVTGNSASHGGGGVFLDDGTITLTNTIVAGNTSGTTGPDVAGGVSSTGHNLIGRTDGSSGWIDTDLTGTSSAPLDPRLGPLADNDGPTKTMALLPGSPAIDAGGTTTLRFDQRGGPFVRVSGGGLDIGAFEVQTLSFTVNTADDELDPEFDPHDLSLREALFYANAVHSQQPPITFAPSLAGVPIRLTLGQLTISDTVTITGLGASLTVIDAQHASRVFDITSPAGDVTLQGLTVTGGRTTGDFEAGGGIRFLSSGTLAIIDSSITGNSTTGAHASGGGIDSPAGAVSLTRSTLADNSTVGDFAYGGGVYSSTGPLTFSSSTISGNSTAGFVGRGGGISSSDGDVTLENSTLSGNSTAGSNATGGGIDAGLGEIRLINSTLSGNSTTGSLAAGGGVFALSGSATLGPVTVSNSIVAGNTSGTLSADIELANYNYLVDGIRAAVIASHSLIGISFGTGLNPAPIGSPDANRNLVGTGAVPVDPRLSPLADNGGPTRTMALLPGSPAIGAGSNALAVDPITNSALTTDQRGAGFSRIAGGTVDIGAFEKQAATIVVTPYDVTYDGLPHSATGSVTGAGGVSLTGLVLHGTTHTDAGDYTDTWTFTDSTGSYLDATGTVQNRIARAPATIVVSPYAVTYDGGPHTATGSAKGVFGESLTGLDLSATTHTNAGSYTDPWTFTDSTGNYLNASGTAQNRIFALVTLTRPRYAPTPLTFADLQAATNFTIPGGHTLGFKIDTLQSGALQITHLGVTTTATVGTVVVAGDTLTWTSLPGATGPADAFRLVAVDLSDNQKSLDPFQFRIDLVNVAPFLSSVTTFSGGIQQTPYKITYAMLQGAANEFDANGDALGFRIRSVQNGTLTITKSGTNTPVPVVLAQTLVEPGDLLTWTGGIGQSGNAFPAFTIRAWDGLAGSGVDIPVKIDVAPFGSQYNLSGPWVVGGRLVNINQVGSILTYTNPNGLKTTGGFTQLTTITGRGGLTGVVDTTTPDNGRIVWSDGVVWLKLSVGGQFLASAPNRPNVLPALVKVIQNGLALKFYNRFGDSADASFVSPTRIWIPKWNLMVTYADGVLKFSNGVQWKKLDLSPSYTESVSGQKTGVIQRTDSVALTFVDTAGGTSPGFWNSPTQVTATAWGSMGTVADGRIVWAGGLRDGETWTKRLVVSGSGNEAGPGFVKIEATNNHVLLTNKPGTVKHACMIDAFALMNLDTGKLVTRKNGKLDFSGWLIWSDFDFNALDAVFADIRTFPFGS